MRHGVSKEFLDGTRRHGCARLPIKKFLASRIGQPWDEVYSEISQEFDHRSYVGHIFYRNLKWYVEVDCWVGAETGTIYDSRDMKVDGFYVHPHRYLRVHKSTAC